MQNKVSNNVGGAWLKKKRLEGDKYTVNLAGKLLLDAFIGVPVKWLN